MLITTVFVTGSRTGVCFVLNKVRVLKISFRTRFLIVNNPPVLLILLLSGFSLVRSASSVAMTINLKVWRESASLILAAKSIFGQSNPYNYKILCLKRSSKSGFMPNTYVFPGGNVSQSDSSLDWLKLYENFGFCKQSFDDLRAVENIPDVLKDDGKNCLPKYLSFRICAIRETFEECGILLCRPKINANTDSNWASSIGKFS